MKIDSISLFNGIAEGRAVISMIFEESLSAHAAVACRDWYENSLDNAATPVVRYGECANVLCETSCYNNELVECIAKAFNHKGRYRSFDVDMLHNTVPNVLFVNSCYGEEETPENNVSSKAVPAADVFSFIRQYTHETGTKIVALQIDYNDYRRLPFQEINYKAISRDLEDLADECNIALFVFWVCKNEEDRFSTIRYFAKHGHNVCLLRTFNFETDPQEDIVMFEFGANKRTFLTSKSKEGGLAIAVDFMRFLLVRNFFWLRRERIRLNNQRNSHKALQPGCDGRSIDWEHSSQIKQQMKSVLRYKFTNNTVTNWFAFAYKRNAMLRKGKGHNTQYAYDPRCEKYLKE